MAELGPLQAVFCTAVILVAFAVRGGTGFGGGAIAVPMLALVFPLPVTVAVVTVLNMLSSVGQGIADWRLISWRDIRRVLPGSLLGIVMGMVLLSNIDTQPLGRALGAFVILYALYSLVLASRLPRVPQRWLKPVAAVTSFAAGIIGALFGGAAGPLYVIYLNAAGLGKDVFRMTITTIMLFQGVVRIAGYAALGLYDAPTLWLLAVALPLMLFGSLYGARVVRKIDQVLFNRFVGAVLLASGGALLIK